LPNTPFSVPSTPCLAHLQGASGRNRHSANMAVRSQFHEAQSRERYHQTAAAPLPDMLISLEVRFKPAEIWRAEWSLRFQARLSGGFSTPQNLRASVKPLQEYGRSRPASQVGVFRLGFCRPFRAGCTGNGSNQHLIADPSRTPSLVLLTGSAACVDSESSSNFFPLARWFRHWRSLFFPFNG